MKPSIISLFLFLAVFSNCQKQESNSTTNSTPVATYDEIVAASEREGIPLSKIGIKRNWDEVLAVAAVYGLADKFKGHERENSGLMFFTDDGLKAYFEREKQSYEIKRQREYYWEKGKSIQCLSDYFNLMDSLPLYRRMGRYPSDEEYADLKKQYFASDYQFFINEAADPSNSNMISPFLIVVSKPEEMPAWKARRIEKR